MTAVLLVFSMILHAAGFYLIALLYIRYQSVKKSEEKQAAMLEEAEQSLAAYLIDLKDENEKLINEIKMSRLKDINIGRNTSHSKKAETEPEDSDFPVHAIDYEDHLELSSSKETVHPQSDEEKVISLYQKGYSSEEIAKELKKGITEIELLLKFRHN
ncbi:DUF6115 domain-containing protein [Bacillus sp. V2I10]|uniref:DUF6115 domain-containing protein n=1 Tax=Bacillus sp. V2I10 TaxID=3042276 RepID=UPI00277ECF7E|nr:Swarming motility protein SwrB [Bacillus sp. V2I10]MDQ0860101.1 hypothetical protein [Bacillus sp. V2I10]